MRETSSELSLSEQSLGQTGGAPPPASFGEDHGPQVIERHIEPVVDDEVVEKAIVLDLAPGDFEAPSNDLLRLAGASAQPSEQLVHRRRQDEDADDVGLLGSNLARALVVDVEDHAGAFRCSPRPFDL